MTLPGTGSGPPVGGDGGGTAVTVIVELPLTPSLVAVMVVAPAAIPVTRPERETLASVGAEETQLKVSFATGLPFASRAAASSWSVASTCSVEETGDTETDATGKVGGALPV